MLIRSLGVGYQPDRWGKLAQDWRRDGSVRDEAWYGQTIFDLIKRHIEAEGVPGRGGV